MELVNVRAKTPHCMKPADSEANTAYFTRKEVKFQAGKKELVSNRNIADHRFESFLIPLSRLKLLWTTERQKIKKVY